MPRFFVVLAVLCACAKAKPAAPAPIQTHVALARAASCDDLSRNVQDTAVRQMRMQLEQEKSQGWYGLPMASGGAVPAASGTPASYTTTNTQVAGVDEADFVKNDGTRIFVLSGQRLYTAKSWPPQDLSMAGSLEIEGWPGTMFLDGNQIAVFSSVWAQSSGAGVSASLCPLGAPCPIFGSTTTKITVVDVSDLAAPKAVSELYLPGYSQGARRVGSSVRLVLSDQVRWPEQVRWWPDYQPGLYEDKDKLARAIDALEDANEAIIRAAPLEGWFPSGQRKLPDGKVIDVGYQCTDFYLANAPERLGLVTIATLDLANLDAGVSRASIVGEAGVLYATQSRLYLASPHWWWWPWAGEHDWTYVHAFDIEDPARAAYLGSGGVEGAVGDQFSMDEKDGYLRIATSTSDWTEDAQGQFHASVGSRLSVLDGRLSLVGQIAPLVEGERVMAMRFAGDKGYAVTFRYIDPLATLDLSDPAHPRKVAELTLPGFSTYLQPIDGTHLLAIGEDEPVDAAGHPDWSRRSVQLALFDVSDLAHPQRTAQAQVGTANAYSEALWDHYAFNWYRPDASKPGLLAIPFSDWLQPANGQNWYDGFVSDVRLFSVDPAGSITPAGALGMNDVYIQEGSGEWTWWYRPWVRRSVMATDSAGNTFVYAISDAGVRAAALSHLESPLATALFPRP
jgi:beta propeller domain-containing protein